jgi:hypothetical protein
MENKPAAHPAADRRLVSIDQRDVEFGRDLRCGVGRLPERECLAKKSIGALLLGWIA